MTALEAVIERLTAHGAAVSIWGDQQGRGYAATYYNEENDVDVNMDVFGDTIESAVLNLFDVYCQYRETLPEPPKKKRGRPRKDRSA